MKSNPVKANPGETQLWNCKNAFEFVCPRIWDRLGQTDEPNIRFCGVCNQNVYLCETPLEFVSQGNLGRCVAIPQDVTPSRAFPREEIQHHFMGRVAFVPPEQIQLREEREKEWWDGVLDQNPTFHPEEINEIRRVYNLKP